MHLCRWIHGKRILVLGSDALLLDLYACPGEPERWVGALDRLCDEMGVRSAVLQTFRVSDAQIHMSWVAQDSGTLARRPRLPSRVEDERNPRLTLSRMQRGMNRIARDEDLFDPDDALQLQLQEQLAMIGLGRFIGSLQPLNHDTYLALALHKAVGDGEDFSAEQVSRLSMLVPHFGQAMGLCERVQASAGLSQRLQKHLDHLRCGLVIVDAKGQVQWLNRSAELRLATPSPLKLQGAHLSAHSAEATARLLKHIAMVAATSELGGNWHYLTLGQGPQLLHLALQPLAETSRYVGDASSVLMVVTGVGHEEAIPVAALVNMFGLTTAESLLVDALIRGHTLEQYAQQRGVALGTVRWQLKQVLSKTGATRQAELVRMVLTSAAAQLAVPSARPLSAMGGRPAMALS